MKISKCNFQLFFAETEPPNNCNCIESNTEQLANCYNTSAACGVYGEEKNSWCYVSNQDSCVDKRESECGGFWVICKPKGNAWSFRSGFMCGNQITKISISTTYQLYLHLS